MSPLHSVMSALNIQSKSKFIPNCYLKVNHLVSEIYFEIFVVVVVVVAMLFYVHGKHLRSCRDGQLT